MRIDCTGDYANHLVVEEYCGRIRLCNYRHLAGKRIKFVDVVLDDDGVCKLIEEMRRLTGKIETERAEEYQ